MSGDLRNRVQPDSRIVVWVDVGTIAEAHMLGRMRDRGAVDMFGARWRVNHSHRTSAPNPAQRCFELLRLGSDGPVAQQMMCWACGSFDVDQVECDDPWYCRGCGSADIEGAPPQPSWEDASRPHAAAVRRR